MAELILDVRLDGFEAPTGHLIRDDYGSLTFTYSAAHLSNPNSHPISLSMPLTDEAFGDQKARPFFDNLLQERDSMLSRVMARENIARDDIAGLLLYLGKDCSGALSVLPAGASPVKVPGDFETDYQEFTDRKLQDIVRSLHERQPLPDNSADPSPLAGVQSKIAITILPDGRIAEPRPDSGAPTTHILKVPGQNHLNDAALEHQAMAFCRGTGIATAETEVLSFGTVQALLVTRFDRGRDENGRVIRLHQEDFAQALGLPASLKYERYGDAGRRFDSMAVCRLLDQTRSPAIEKRRFIELTLANLMLGNVDAHAKNHALLYQPDGQLDLAPAYDIFPTAIDPNLTDEFSFRIGHANKLKTLTKNDVDLFLSDLGIRSAAARGRLLNGLIEKTGSRICDQISRLSDPAMKRLADMVSENIRTVFEITDLPVPKTILERDAFVARGGGWLLS